MAATNGTSSTIHRVLVLGVSAKSRKAHPESHTNASKDNRLATSIISGLSNDPNLEVHQSTHTGSIIETTPNITIHKIDDTQSSSLISLFQSIKPDIIFSTKSGGSFCHQKEIIDSAIEANIPRFVPCEWGQDSLNERIQERLPPQKERGKTIAYLREQTEKNKVGFSWVAVATGCSLEHSLISGNLGFDIEWQSATVHGTGDEEFAACSTAWPGKVALAIIENWMECKNQYLYASGFPTTANSILEAFRTQTGKEWTAGKVDVEDTMNEAERRLERGFPDASMFLMERSVLFDEGLDSVRPFVEQDAKTKLGLEGETLEPVVERVLHDFKHHGKGGCGCD